MSKILIVAFDETHSFTMIEDEAPAKVTEALRLPATTMTGLETTMGTVRVSVAVHTPSMQENVGNGREEGSHDPKVGMEMEVVPQEAKEFEPRETNGTAGVQLFAIEVQAEYHDLQAHDPPLGKLKASQV